jgi:hypothetical protein
MPPWSETDLLLVASAGTRWGAGAEDRALAGICAAAEAELREREWQAFTTVLPHMAAGVVVLPAEDPERSRVLIAVVDLNWHVPAPGPDPAADPGPVPLAPRQLPRPCGRRRGHRRATRGRRP